MRSVRTISKLGIATLLLFLWTAVAASASVIWDEAIDGSLSTDRLATTDMGTLGIGSNDIIATLASGIGKFYSITIASGSELSALIVEDIDPGEGQSFIAVVSGAQFTVDPAAPDVTQLLGYVQYGTSDVGQDVLGSMGAGPGSQGFSGALGAGTYSFWARQGALDPETSDLNFVVTSLPEPSFGLLLGVGLLLLNRRQRRD